MSDGHEPIIDPLLEELYGGLSPPDRAREVFSGLLKVALRRPAGWLAGVDKQPGGQQERVHHQSGHWVSPRFYSEVNGGGEKQTSKPFVTGSVNWRIATSLASRYFLVRVPDIHDCLQSARADVSEG